MTERLHRITDRALLKAITAHEGSFQTTQAILEGWPRIEPGGWEPLRREFLESCRRMETLAESSPRLEARLLPE
jgi:hypothetical protein